MVNGLVFFAYTEGFRGVRVFLQLFRDYQGAIQMDSYAGYNILEKLEGIMILGCWVHIRRYFDRTLSHDKARAEYPWLRLACFMMWRAWQTTSIWIPSSACY